MHSKPLFLCLLATLLTLTGCIQTTSSLESSGSSVENESNQSVDSRSNSSDSASPSTDENASLAAAIKDTESNFELEMSLRSVDALEPQNNRYKYESQRYDANNKIFWKKYVSVNTDNQGTFEEAKDNLDNYYQDVFYYDEEDSLQKRYKNPGDDVWSQFINQITFSFDEKITDYIIPEHFEEVEAGVFNMKEEYLGTEECSYLTNYYGSYAYLIQDFEYVTFTVKNGKLNQYKTKVHFTKRPETSWSYDSTTEIIGTFSNIGNTSLEVPALPVYAEDLLPEQKELESAKVATEDNYTYEEKYTVTDVNNNSVEHDYIEAVNGRSFRYYKYNDEVEGYIDSYTYNVTSAAFTGNLSTTTYETDLIYWPDGHVEYNTYDMDIEDDSLSKVAIMGAGYGTKIYEYNEAGGYYTPRREKPEKSNREDLTYLGFASRAFIHGINGEYTSSDGTSYHYDYIDLRFYLSEDGKLSKATYQYDLTITKNGISNIYRIEGAGNFSKVGTTSIIVPADPNLDIQLDSRLEGLYNNINLENYTYTESYSIEDDDGNKVELYGIDATPVYENKLEEKASGRYVCSSGYGYVQKPNTEDEYDVEYVDQYFYYGDYNVVQTYTLNNYGKLTFEYPGSYSFSPCIEGLKDYLKYFKYNKQRTIDGKVAYVFSMQTQYRKLYASNVIRSISANQTLDFSDGTLNLIVIDDEIYKISYEYNYYDTNNKYVGLCSGTINIGDFGTTEVTIPGFVESDYKVTTLDDAVACLSKRKHKVSDATINVSYFAGNSSCEWILKDGEEVSLTTNKDNNYYINNNGVLCFDTALYEKDRTFEILSYEDIDLSKIKQSDYLCDTSGNFVLSPEAYDTFYKDTLHLDTKYGEGNYQGRGVSISATNVSMKISVNYSVRFALENGKYAVFYVSQVVTYSIFRIPVIG